MKNNFWLPLAFFILSSLCGFSQKNQTSKVSDSTEKNLRIMPIPYLSYDRTLEFTFGALPLAMYTIDKNDTVSPQSLTGVLGFYSTNESWFTLSFSKFFLLEDRYRASLAGGIGFFNYQTYVGFPIDQFVDYGTKLGFFMIELQRRIIKNLYGGISYTFLSFNNEFYVPSNPTSQQTINSLGLILAYDNRTSVYYPTEGGIGDIKTGFNPEKLGNESSNTKIEVNYNHYFSINKRDVIAARTYTGFGIGDMGFNQQFVVGQSDVRGYTQGKYRGDQLADLQVEYRFNPFKKIGFVFFTGVAMVFNATESAFNGEPLPSIGTGFRINVFPDNHMNVGLDTAIGKDDWGIYFRIGEAF